MEASCRVFLWTDSDAPSNKATVSWDKVCLPKVSEGLGLKNSVTWNKKAEIILGTCTQQRKAMGEVGLRILNKKITSVE